MKIVVVGPGALGSLFYSLLKGNTDHELFFLDHNPGRTEYLRRQGLFLLKGGEQHHTEVSISCNPEEIGAAEAVLLCVKSAAVEKCLEALPVLLGENGLLIAFQNGISHLDLLQQQPALKGRFALGVTSEGASSPEAGWVVHGGSGITRIGFSGPPAGQSAAILDRLVQAMNRAGFMTVIEKDILAQVWNKLLVNAGINALTVIYNCPNGQLLERDDARAALAAAVKEAAAVARAKNIAIIDDPVGLTEEICRKTAANISSMLQDVRKKRTTEIEAINGAIVREAAAYGLPVPVNTELVEKVKKIEQPPSL
jgi:2-dehydropantoate 2-reductase